MTLIWKATGTMGFRAYGEDHRRYDVWYAGAEGPTHYRLKIVTASEAADEQLILPMLSMDDAKREAQWRERVAVLLKATP